jgi:hypothetical protein
LASGDQRLRALPEEERRQFCRQVLEHLSELVEGEAEPDLCARVESILGDCASFLALRNTLEATIRLSNDLGEEAPCAADEEAFQRCVENVKSVL